MRRVIALCALVTIPCLAQDINIAKPADREFVVDNASMLTGEDKATITALCGQCLRDRAIPIVVVTIPSMASCAPQNLSIEAFAKQLFNQWEMGYRVVNGVSWNRGVLFVVSRADRKARIELGRDWHHSYDGVCKSVMDGQIIPHFKTGNYSSGIVAGVAGLDAMARGLRPPSSPWGCNSNGMRWGFMPSDAFVFTLMFLFMFIIAAVRRALAWFRGDDGVPSDDYGDPHHHRPRAGQASFDDSDMSSPITRQSSWGGFLSGSSSSDSSFSGGSFGGGSSGGGGTTGSW